MRVPQANLFQLRYEYIFGLRNGFIVYDLPSSLMEGRLPETVLKGGAGSGVLRPRLVTAGSGGPGHRPPGTTTWLRGARCTDPEAMPEMEARPPAENRHGGAPRGERPASWDAPHSAGCGSVASHKRDKRNSAPVGAPPTPLRVGCE